LEINLASDLELQLQLQQLLPVAATLS